MYGEEEQETRQVIWLLRMSRHDIIQNWLHVEKELDWHELKYCFPSQDIRPTK
jgi:hypothetical protein